jgi:hypothetical protein
MKTEKKQPQRMISVPEKTFLRMVLKLNEDKILFPKKVEDAEAFLKNVN